MTFQNCPKCGRLFQKMISPVCDKCAREEEALFDKVKEFINENPGSSIEIISDATGMSIKRILKYLREGRLEPSVGMGNLLDCEGSGCKRKIAYGRYCEKCTIDMNHQIKDAFTKKKGVGMYTRM